MTKVSFWMVCGLLLSTTMPGARSEMVVLRETESPTNKMALATDAGSAGRIWLVSLPGKHPIGQPFESGDFIGLPSRGRAEWNAKRGLVALTQGGIPYSETKLLRYSQRGLKEIPLPDLAPIADRWFHFGPANVDTAEGRRRRRTYVGGVRWTSKDDLMIRVSGDATDGSGERMRFWMFSINCVVHFDRQDQARVIRVMGGPLEAM